jgi:hypothetical protein
LSLRSKPLEILERGCYFLRLMRAARRVVGLAARIFATLNRFSSTDFFFIIQP